jgi:hypothetical protein
VISRLQEQKNVHRLSGQKLDPIHYRYKKEPDTNMTEKTLEDIIAKYPELVEEGLALQERQATVCGRRIDLLFRDSFGRRLLIELKAGPIKDEHIGQLLSYEGSLVSGDDPSIRVMLVGTRVPPNLRRALDHHGIAWKELTVPQIEQHLAEKHDDQLISVVQEERPLTDLQLGATRPRETGGPSTSSSGGRGGGPRYSVGPLQLYEIPSAVKYFFEAVRVSDQAAVIAHDSAALNALKVWEARNPDRVREYAKRAGVPVQAIGIRVPDTGMFKGLQEDPSAQDPRQQKQTPTPAPSINVSLESKKVHVMELVRQRESHTLEFKETLFLDVRAGQETPGIVLSSLKTIAAFLNGSGGTLLVGVNDSGVITGIERDFPFTRKHDTDGFELKLRDLLMTRIQPAPLGKVCEARPEG